MTISFRVSSFVCILAAFIWQIGTETQWATASHAEEEEKKINVVLGNLSLKNTPQPFEDDSTSITKAEPDIYSSTGGELSLIGTRTKFQANFTDSDELRENVHKNDASPENSVERESSEENDDIHKDNLKNETPLMMNDTKESSLDYDDTLPKGKTTSSYEDTSDDDVLIFNNTSCSANDTDCISTPVPQLERIASPRIEEKIFGTTSNPMDFSASSPLWNVVKSVKPQNEADVTSSVSNFPFRTTVYSPGFTASTEGSTTAQTLENVIPVEGTAIHKLDSVTDPHSNKTEKSKSSKQTETTNPSNERSVRPIVKVLTTTPETTVTKEEKSNANPELTTLLSKFIESISTKTPDSVYSFNNRDFTDQDYPTSVPAFVSFSKFETSLHSISSSPMPKHSTIFPEYNSPFLSLFTTPSWFDTKSSDVSSDEKSKEKSSKGIPEATPRLLPSFRESSSTVFKLPGSRITTTSHEVTSESSYTAPSSSPLLPATTIQPQLSSRIVVKDSTPLVATGKESYIPPPRLTNPGCSSLPVCMEITLLDTTWDEFCPQAREFQEFLAKDVSHIIHPIHPHQVILEADGCVESPPVYPIQTLSGITVALFVIDDSGEYNEKLTEICALILRKWAPTTFRNSVMEVRLFNNELQATSMPVIPELNSGFVAAVSISAVAGVALCMLCILLVVMKQKLLQSRNSDSASPAGDAYSLDSLSINASFRRRRNRKSARSYLNHAFSDQEIPSHPLNAKSLLNYLKNRELLEEEFKRIPMNMAKLDQIPDGAHVKNRYSNILPTPETRVLLADPSGDPLKCYINANYIKGFGGKPSTYIACQAPLPEGIEDFWRMVWEQQSKVIIMLTMFEENGISRCTSYFPQSTLVAHPPYGDFQVSLQKKDVYEFYTKSTLRLLDIEKNLFRDIVHLWFTKWPDVGVPKDPSILIYFVQQSRSYTNCNPGPTVVHCSTGTGRTGVFLALDICMREYDESRSIDILQCVSQLRNDRGGAVQNKDQYILIHEALQEYITHPGNQSQRSSIQS